MTNSVEGKANFPTTAFQTNKPITRRTALAFLLFLTASPGCNSITAANPATGASKPTTNPTTVSDLTPTSTATSKVKLTQQGSIEEAVRSVNQAVVEGQQGFATVTEQNRFIQELATLLIQGKKLPSRLVTTNSSPSGFNPETGVVSVNVYQPFTGVADFLIWENPNLAQVLEANMYGGADWEPPDEPAMVLASYMEYGESLRRKLRYFQEIGPQDKYQKSQAQYDTIKAWLGVDISTYGKVKELIPYQIGDVVSVEDDQPEVSGILLRLNPHDLIEPQLPYVTDGDSVQIMNGPELIIDQRRRQAFEMYRVEKGKIVEIGVTGSVSRTWVFDERIEGWMPKFYLGKKLAKAT